LDPSRQTAKTWADSKTWYVFHRTYNMSGNHRQRVLTAIIMVPTVLSVVFFAPPVLFLAAAALLALFTIREYIDLTEKLEMAPMRYVAYAMALLLFVPRVEFAAPLMAIAALTLAMRPSRDLVAVAPGAAAVVLGVAYTALPWRLFVEIHEMPNGIALACYALLIVAVSDTSAYYGGRAFGRHKLAPRISPGKTWEGTVCSTLVSMLVGYFYIRHFFPAMEVAENLLLALSVNIAGQIGDLAESAIKRGAGVKDSGTLLPGHGGILDRVDALLFAIPVLWYDIKLIAFLHAKP
jgi:phosphatidate cytidylyltransferase